MTFKIPYSLFSLLLCVSSAFAAEIPDYPFVFVVGKADIDTPPNIATCSLSIRGIDLDPGKAESAVDGRLKSVLATLSAKRILPSDIESSRIDKQIMPDESRNSEPASIRGYDVSRHLKFTARQLDVLPSIELTLTGSPNIESINCQFDRLDRAVTEHPHALQKLGGCERSEMVDSNQNPYTAGSRLAVESSRFLFN